MWWEERCWLLLDVEWEAGRQKQGSPGYCCSVGGYQQPGSPLSSWHCCWAEGAMDGTTSLSLSLSPAHTPHPLTVPVFFILLFFLFFSTNTLSSYNSPCISYSASILYMGFPQFLLNALPPTPTFCQWMEVSEFCSGLIKIFSPPTHLTPHSFTYLSLSSALAFSFLRAYIDPTAN